MRWTIQPKSDDAIVTTLATALGIDPILASLLIQRGITTYDQAKSFFRPSLSDLHDPLRNLA